VAVRPGPEHDQRRSHLRGPHAGLIDARVRIRRPLGVPRGRRTRPRPRRGRAGSGAGPGGRARERHRLHRAAGAAPARAGPDLSRDRPGAAPDRAGEGPAVLSRHAGGPHPPLHLRREHRPAGLRRPGDGALPLPADAPAHRAGVVDGARRRPGARLHHRGELAPGRQGRRVGGRDLHLEQAPRVPQDHRPAAADPAAARAGARDPRSAGARRRRSSC
jgi:hypothetical protein